MMIKYIKCLPILCLILCLLLSGCGESGENDAASYENVDTRTYIGVPKDPDAETEDTEPSETEEATDTAPDTAPVIPPVTDTPDVTEDTETDTEAVVPDSGFVDTDGETTVMEATYGNINLDGILSPETPVSGTLVSRQSERLLLLVKYNCRMKMNGAVAVDLEVGLQFYNLVCGAKKDMGYITVDGETVKFSTDEISREGKGTYYLPFTEYSFECSPEASYCDIEAGWDFRGSYAGVKIDMLTAGCTLSWNTGHSGF